MNLILVLNFLVSSALVVTVKSSSREAKVTEKILSDMGLVKQPDYKHVSFFKEIYWNLKIIWTWPHFDAPKKVYLKRRGESASHYQIKRVME